jgi:hypothetical protein
MFQERNVKAKMNFIENLLFSFLERVFPTKALPYSFFPQERCLSEKERGKIYVGFKIGLAFLFTLAGIARAVCCVVQPQASENNVLLIAVVGILLFEIACFAAASFAGKNG